MNILLINHYAGSPEMGMEFRPYYLSREWMKMGHQVFIIAGDHSHLRVKNPNVSQDMQKQNIDGITYYWLKTGMYKGNGVKRALTMFRFCRKLLSWKNWIIKNLRPDVVISSSTYPIDSIPASRIAKGAGAKYIHEVHDMWPSTLAEIGGMSKHNPFVMLMQFGENFAYRHADAVVSLPKYAEDYMRLHGLAEGKFHYVPNGIVLEEWEKPEKIPNEHLSELQRLKDKGKFIVGYFGGHALSNNLWLLLQTAERMRETQAHFILVGDGVEKEALMRYAKTERLQNVSFLSPVDKSAIPSLTEWFDCIYMGSKPSPLYRFGLCLNKLFDSMMAAKPIILAFDAPPSPVTESECGLVVKPEDVEGIAGAIRTLMAMSHEERDAMGQRGRKEVLEKYNYPALAREFLEVMK